MRDLTMANDLVRGWFTWPRLWSRDHLALWGQALDHLAPNQNASQNANLVLGSLSPELNPQSERGLKPEWRAIRGTVHL